MYLPKAYHVCLKMFIVLKVVGIYVCCQKISSPFSNREKSGFGSRFGNPKVTVKSKVKLAFVRV